MKCVVSRIVSHILEMINPIKSMFQRLSPPLSKNFKNVCASQENDTVAAP